MVDTLLIPKLPTSADELRKAILSISINSLKMNTYFDNFDSEVFNSDGVDRSKIFNTEERVFYFDCVYMHFQRMYQAYALLGNDESKKLFIILICYRLASHFSVKIPLDYSKNSPEYLEYRKNELTTTSDLKIGGMFGKLKHLDFEHQGKRYKCESTGSLDSYLFCGQYFYNKNSISIMPKEGDYVVDGGAFTGETAVVFSNAVGEGGKVYSFDPIQEHLDIMDYNFAQHHIKNIQVMPYGCSNVNNDFPPLSLNHYDPGFRANISTVPLKRMDTLVDMGIIKKIDFIKLDVEGSEIESLEGAAESIKKYKPKLAISLYHKPNDIFEIIEFVHKTFDFYKNYYIGHYSIQQGETVLYVS